MDKKKKMPRLFKINCDVARSYLHYWRQNFLKCNAKASSLKVDDVSDDAQTDIQTTGININI